MASRPQGGFVLWVELPRMIDTVELYREAVKRRISFAPGRIFTQQDQFGNCLRLNYGLQWNDKLDGHLKTLGRLAKAEM
jgi:DNA-binding transcriptional MocR family regulator